MFLTFQGQVRRFSLSEIQHFRSYMQSLILNFSLLWLQHNNKCKSKEDVAELG